MAEKQINYHLGEVSERYESSEPGTISTGKGDHGGVSYGTYQLSSAMGILDEYLKQSAYKGDFKGLVPDTKAFNDEWILLADTDHGFALDQQKFIKETLYDKQLAILKTAGIDMSNRGRAVQEAIWSTSVQYGNLTKHVFKDGLEESFGENYRLSKLTDKDVVVAVQDYKIAHLEVLFSHSQPQWAGLRARAEEEKADLIALADGRPLPARSQEHSHAHQNVLVYGARGEAVTSLQTELSRRGYANRDGHALRADGDFGTETLLAVEAFQHDQRLAADGKVGPQTQRALQTATYAAREQAAALGESQAPLQAFSDPSHPQYAMYAALQKWLPQGTSEARLAQATTACHLARIRKPEEVSGIYSGGDGKILFTTNSLFARMAQMDVSQPAPAVQQSMQQVQQFDQQQQQVQAPQEQMQQPMGQHGSALRR